MENTSTLNDLIEINNDRIAGYEKATKLVDDADLHQVFADMASQSRMFASELRMQVQSMGDKPAEGTTTRGKIYRIWMDVKDAFSGNDRVTVLGSCEFGEDAAQRAYAAALDEKDVTPAVKAIIERQKSELKLSHDKIRNMRDREKVH